MYAPLDGAGQGGRVLLPQLIRVKATGVEASHTILQQSQTVSTLIQPCAHIYKSGSNKCGAHLDCVNQPPCRGYDGHSAIVHGVELDEAARLKA